jgi:hypothetical protein
MVTPTPNIRPLPAAPPPSPIFFSYALKYCATKDYTPLIIFTNLGNIFVYMIIIVRSMYNFVNCLQFNIRYEKVECTAPMGSALVELSHRLVYTCLGHVNHRHHVSSVVRPSTFHILIFSSETTWLIATKLWQNSPWVAPFQDCVRWSQLPTKMAAKLKNIKRGDEK